MMRATSLSESPRASRAALILRATLAVYPPSALAWVVTSGPQPRPSMCETGMSTSFPQK